ncbi:hypothetical protein AV530_004827 [Patagioenas fasciata monilis]|uniref:Uncharacterized protein n=1 Tax=Patagioenas fasciata monilis TaxID=372326 RepID=A0A1V4KEB7_PATFA|nr:hypothetical protein AV530_004827 [Patagioenas fasciata monilis]
MTWATLKFVAPGIKDHNLAKERPLFFLQIQVELDRGAKGRAVNDLACYSWVRVTGEGNSAVLPRQATSILGGVCHYNWCNLAT